MYLGVNNPSALGRHDCLYTHYWLYMHESSRLGDGTESRRGSGNSPAFSLISHEASPWHRTFIFVLFTTIR